jgi:hypothetical protein
MTEETNFQSSPTSSTPPSPLPVILFVIIALFLPCGLFGYNLVTWFAGQFAIASLSAGFLAWADRLGLLAQSFVLLIIIAPLSFFTRDARFRPIYQSWLIAVVFAFPAALLRFLDTNSDQLGAVIQIGLGLLASLIVFVIRRKSLAFNPRPVGLALAALPVAVAPFAIFGAPGSGFEIVLSLIAGLSFGLLAALLIAPTAGNFLLNGLGIGGLLAILGSAFGHDGQQLMLIAALPAFGYAVAALSPSAAANTLFVGLLAAAPLVFFDSTEFTIVLGDISGLATRATLFMIILGFVLGVLLWGAGKVLKLNQSQGNRLTAAIPFIGAVVTWLGLLAVFFTLGHPGFYGDRLFVVLKDQADVSAASKIADRDERLAWVYQTLTTHADATQFDLRAAFDRLGAKYTPYYLVNAIEVENSPLVRLYLLTRSDVDRVLHSPRLRPAPEDALGIGPNTSVIENPGWNIQMIGADRVWTEFGVIGKDIVVGQSDSGVDGDHPALRGAYRGLDSGPDYNWFDPWDGTTSPNDEGGHGTHTLGSILGVGGIGVAPGAQWIGCVNLDRNLANPALYLDCMQFMLAPFPHSGDPFNDGDPTKAAHVLNNSWGCPPIEGCDPTVLQPAADALRAAGIFVVVSTGNDGPNCSTVESPLSLYDSVFSVGAVDQEGNLADFSSRGPVTADGSNRMKPDIAAPGVEVFSSLPGGTYGPNSGTSMAGPHLVGVVALLWSAQPKLIGDIEGTEAMLRETAQPYNGIVRQPGGCDDLPLPNNGVGAGIVDAYAAVQRALGK